MNPTSEVTIPISGMTCASCAAHIERALREVPEVLNASVNLATERAKVKLATAEVDTENLIQAVRDAGYDVPTEALILPIGGMTCASCASHVEGALSSVAGVVSASVNLATERASVTYIPGLADTEDFRRAVAETGYQVVDQDKTSVLEEDQVDQEERKMRAARFRMQVSWGFTIPIILWMFAEMFFGIMWPNATIYNLGMVVLALPVLFWVGWHTYRGAWAAVTHGHANHDHGVPPDRTIRRSQRQGARFASDPQAA